MTARKVIIPIIGAALAILFFEAPSALAQVPYVTNLENAFFIARQESRIVALYTGRSVFCEGKSPRDFFFDFIVKKHPEFGTQSNRFVICEQFMFAPNDTNGPAREFMQEVRKYDSLYQRYHLRVFYPTLTFLDEKARLLNGPFWSMIKCDAPFSSTDDDCYVYLKDYLADASPMNMGLAQSKLEAAVLPVGSGGNVCGFFRSISHTNGGQQELLMENGLPSRQYELGAPFRFQVQEVQIDRGKLAKWYDESQVWVIGRFEGSEPYSGAFVFRLNGAWFRGTMRAFRPAPPPLQTDTKLKSAKEGDYWFVLTTRSESVGQALLAEMERRRHSGVDEQHE